VPALVAKAALALLTAARSPDFTSIQELNLSFAALFLAVGDNPDVCADAGVVEHLLGQSDDRFQPIVLDEPLSNVALARAGASREHRRSAEDNGEAGSVLVLSRAYGL